MKYNLFLDDFRMPTDAFRYTLDTRYNILKWEIVRSFNEFTEIIEKKGLPQLISLDHDLADVHYDGYPFDNGIDYSSYTEKTGYDCAKWLCDYCLENNLSFPNYLIHSCNSVGSKNIDIYIKNFKKYNPEIK
jgi:hypothetical protein